MTPRRLIGEALIAKKLITNEQLEEGLRYQVKVKKLIGSSLVELGYLRKEALEGFLNEFIPKSDSYYINEQEIQVFDNIDSLISRDLKKWLIFMVDRKASDLHLTSNNLPQLRINGRLTSINIKPLTSDNIKDLIYSILTYEEIETFKHSKALDKAFEIKDVSRYRINIHCQSDSPGLSVRALPIKVPGFAELGIPEILKEFAVMPSGLVLLTGPAGCGKSTTLAAMIEHVNNTRDAHIVTIEDPVEYVFSPKKSLITQRELGRDTISFQEALKSVVRQDPNIILIGEMRDLETIRAALILAETGHLVLSTLHTQDATHSVNRIVDVFPVFAQHEIRVKLSLVLQGVVVQQLIPRTDTKGRVLACEILKCTTSIRNLIRENSLNQIRSFIQMGGQHGMISMNQSLFELYNKGMITWEEVYARSNDREELLRLMPAAY